MYTIGHNFKVGDTVWVVDDTEVRNCIVTHLVMEVDSSGVDSIQETVSYHLNPITVTSYKIYVRDESEVFPTFEGAVLFLSDNSLIYPSLSTNIAEYKYTVREIVWAFDEDTPLECEVIKVTIDMLHENPTTISYGMLSNDKDYGVIDRMEADIYATEQLAIDHLKSVMDTKYN
jgi:hypothetical protein